MAGAVAASGLSASQLATIKRTIAKNLNDNEFDLFMEACRSYQLDPFRRQIVPAIYNADDPKKRSMTLITTRDGLRVIASRCGDYRPASEPAKFDYLPEDAPKRFNNPLRILSATVTLYKRDPDGVWYPVIGQAYWDEYVPASDGAWKKSQWPKMPRVMITKCAEAAALRAGWPDAFAGLYLAEEQQSAQTWQDDASASAIAAQGEAERRQRRVGSGIIFFMDGGAAEKIPAGQVFDRVSEWAGKVTDQDVLDWRGRNQVSLNEFWAMSPSDALALKDVLEPRCEAAIAALKSTGQEPASKTRKTTTTKPNQPKGKQHG